jgi:hypothetical protein
MRNQVSKDGVGGIVWTTNSWWAFCPVGSPSIGVLGVTSGVDGEN